MWMQRDSNRKLKTAVVMWIGVDTKQPDLVVIPLNFFHKPSFQGKPLRCLELTKLLQKTLTHYSLQSRSKNANLETKIPQRQKKRVDVCFTLFWSGIRFGVVNLISVRPAPSSRPFLSTRKFSLLLKASLLSPLHCVQILQISTPYSNIWTHPTPFIFENSWMQV